MLASFSWLDEYVNLKNISIEEVADKLTMVGLEVEDLRDSLAHLKSVVAAEVVETVPSGSKLNLVTLGCAERGLIKVLCGDATVEKGKIYPLALVGAELPVGKVGEKTIGDIVSSGMLCSAMELGLGARSDRVMELRKQDYPFLAPGRSLSEILKFSDWGLEISVTPNRGDALCIMGIARELSACLNRPLKSLQIRYVESLRSAFDQISVAIEAPEHCWRYTGRIINGVTPSPGPDWMARRLISAGLRPINNIVDVTNYVMLELGLPLHAFDLAKIAGPSIIVKTYGPGRKITTLDGVERTLKAEHNIVISDAEKAVGLGGIMGCLNSEVDSATKDVFLESALFNPATIRKTSKALGLSTDASYRFERGQDPNFCSIALNRAVGLIAELCSTKVAQGRLDVYPKLIRPKEVNFRPSRCKALLGTNYKKRDIERALGAIGLTLEKKDKDCYLAIIPTFRPDLTREVDIIEEVVRLLDFNSLPATLPHPPAAALEPPLAFNLREKLRDILVAAGYCEHLSYSFINRDFVDKLDLPPDHNWRSSLVSILNPLSEDQGVLRPSLVPGLLSALRLNQYHGQWDAALFETGTIFCFSQSGGQIVESQKLAVILAGQLGRGRWSDPKRAVDFWDIKGLVELLAEKLDLDLSFGRRGGLIPPFINLVEGAAIFLNGTQIGYLGLLSARSRKNLALKEAGGQVYILEIEIDNLPLSTGKPFKPWSGFPGVTRDLAVVVDSAIESSNLIASISALRSLPLADITVFDLYRGDKVPKGKKSLALRLFFQSKERTLTDELVNGYFKTILETLSNEFEAVLRS
ncbi:MAG: phenylalanine--tRNA ligase subunit beta [Deltaproteobacteria bacterium]|jgi:phenylalanyl-tRNA synthetase beta chain|nr:phenylalanine--tRNA ligase subunit beta [Deltaproteobacteria bacterium]